MGGKSSKPDDGAVLRCEVTYRLVAELRSLGVPSGPPSVPMLEDSSLHSVSIPVAIGTPELKEAISKNHVLRSFINDHLGLATIATLRSLSSVRSHLDKAGLTLADVSAALACLERENAERNDRMYSEAVGKLKESRAVGDPFAGPDLDAIKSDCEKQHSLRSALRQRKHELEKRLGSIKKWRKAWNVIYTVGILVVLACSVLLAAVTSLPAAITAATASATAMKCVEPCINSLWDEREGSLAGEKDVIEAMRKCGLAVHELVGIGSSVEKLNIDIDAMLKAVDFAIRGGEEEMMVKAEIERIMAKKGEVEKGIESLNESLKEKVDWCT